MRIQGKKNFLKNWLIISSMESILALKIKQLTKNHSINCCKYCGKKFKLKKRAIIYWDHIWLLKVNSSVI